MGHFSMTCSSSGLPISGGTAVRCLLLVSSPYDERDGGARGAWVARTPPLRALYNDYGTIEKVNKEDKDIADLWLRGLKEDLVVKGLGDNSYHDLPTSRSMTFDQLLDALRAGRVEVHQDARHFWRRPVDDSWMDGLKDESLPMFKRVEKVVATIGKVDSNATPDSYVVDEPVPNLVRVRFGQYQHDDAHKEALARAKDAIEKAGFTATIAAGSGRSPDSADLIVLNPPNKDQPFKGAQWDMAAGQKSDDDKRLSVRLAMVREDVWQELIAYPRSQYVALDCTNCGQSPAYHGGKGKSERECPNESINNQPFKKHKKGSTYEHGPVFPKGVEHVVTKSAYGSEYAWFGLAAFKANVREAWKEIVAYFDRQARIERGEKVKPTKEEKAEKVSSPEIEKMLAGFEAKRKEEEKRVAALPKEEQEKIRATQKARTERYEKAQQERLANPVFGDFLISDFVLPHRHDAVGTWIFRHELPGVLGIPEHLSMCLADKTEVTAHLLDALAELGAFQYAMRDVGCVWKPAASTGPQDPEWKEQIRFHATLLAISRKLHEKHIEDMDSEDAAELPTTIGEAIARFKSPGRAK